MKYKSLITLTVAAIGILGLTACDDADGIVTEQEEVSIKPIESKEAQDEVQKDEATQEQVVDPKRPALGDTWTYDDGLAVSVSEPSAFTPGEYAAGGEDAENHVKLEVRIQNNTGQDFDPSMVYITASSGGTEAEEVVDFDQSLEGAPMTTLLDGQSTTYAIGFGVNDPADITVEFNDMNDFDRDSVIFLSK